MKSLFALTFVFIIACATGPSYVEPTPPSLGPQAIMAAGTCTAMPHDPTPNLNPTAGWLQTVPGVAGFQCGSKYGSGPFYCASPASCPGSLIWGTHPTEADRGKEWHGLIDLLKGSILACAERANKQAVHSADCELIPHTATDGKPVRVILPVVVPPLLPGGFQQTATTVQVRVKAAPGSGEIIVGQLGFAEQAQ